MKRAPGAVQCSVHAVACGATRCDHTSPCAVSPPAANFGLRPPRRLTEPSWLMATSSPPHSSLRTTTHPDVGRPEDRQVEDAGSGP